MQPRKVIDAAGMAALSRVAVEVFAARSNVLAAYLYGSAARGEAARDLDIVVLLDHASHRPHTSHEALEAMAAALQLLGAPHGPEIDLRVLNGAAPRFAITVLREGKLLYERDRDLRLTHEARCMSAWADFRPTWERMRSRMLERWQRTSGGAGG